MTGRGGGRTGGAEGVEEQAEEEKAALSTHPLQRLGLTPEPARRAYEHPSRFFKRVGQLWAFAHYNLNLSAICALVLFCGSTRKPVSKTLCIYIYIQVQSSRHWPICAGSAHCFIAPTWIWFLRLHWFEKLRISPPSSRKLLNQNIVKEYFQGERNRKWAT